MSFKPERMELLSIVVLADKIDAVMKEILSVGILHPEDIKKTEDIKEHLGQGYDPYQIKEYEDLEKRTLTLLGKLGLKPQGKTLEQALQFPFSPSQIKQKLDEIESRLTPVLMKKDSLTSQLKAKEAMLGQIDVFTPIDFYKKSSSRYTFLEIKTGTIAKENFDILERSLSSIPAIILPFKELEGKIYLFLTVLKKDKSLLDKVLKSVSFEEITAPAEFTQISQKAKDAAKEQVKELKDQIFAAEGEIFQIAQKHKEFLYDVFSLVRIRGAIAASRRGTLRTKNTYLICGWVPVDEKNKIIRRIKKIAPKSYIEEKDAEEIEKIKDKKDIPVKLKNPKLLSPFEMLIRTYSLPRYGSVDPTAIVAVTFPLMFGAMFGDIGHGLVLALIGMLINSYRRRNLKSLGTLILYSGLSSVVFGFLYGSFFGVEKLFPALWIKPLYNIMFLFKLTIFFGIGVITLGILFNIINALSDHDYVKAFFDKAGLIGGLIYWLGIGIVVKLFFSGKVAEYTGLLVAVILGLVFLLFLRIPVEKAWLKKKKKTSDILIETFVELVEIFIGYLANTISFVRIAAFSLAHIGLFMAVFGLSEMVRNSSLGGSASILILILGNILIIGLEGLVVSIQSIRLNYYEFFSKFFISSAKKYKPIKF